MRANVVRALETLIISNIKELIASYEAQIRQRNV